MSLNCVFKGDNMKKLIIFGFEGTIADTTPGALYCFNTTATAMGYTPVASEALYDINGLTLEQSFERLYGMRGEEIEYAAKNYSKLYSQKGEEMLLFYDGIDVALSKLKESGCKLAIATQLNRRFTTDMFSTHIDVGQNFDLVCATDVDSNLNKAGLIMQACNELGVSVEDSIYVGDSHVDAIGAQEVGIDFVAALYGWGFSSREEAEQYNCKAYLNTVAEVFLKLSVL